MQPGSRKTALEGAPHPALLRRIDPERNMARFYAVSVELTLFEDYSCTRRFGRIGTSDRILIGLHETRQQAEAAMTSLIRRKQAKGYRSTD